MLNSTHAPQAQVKMKERLSSFSNKSLSSREGSLKSLLISMSALESWRNLTEKSASSSPASELSSRKDKASRRRWPTSEPPFNPGPQEPKRSVSELQLFNERFHQSIPTAPTCKSPTRRSRWRSTASKRPSRSLSRNLSTSKSRSLRFPLRPRESKLRSAATKSD